MIFTKIIVQSWKCLRILLNFQDMADIEYLEFCHMRLPLSDGRSEFLKSEDLCFAGQAFSCQNAR